MLQRISSIKKLNFESINPFSPLTTTMDIDSENELFSENDSPLKAKVKSQKQLKSDQGSCQNLSQIQ
jgi:hypothetical protein